MRLTTRQIYVTTASLSFAAMMAFTAASLDDPEWSLPAPPPSATQFDIELKGYVLGLRMIKADYEGYVGPDGYAVRSQLRTSGLAALLKKLKIWAVTTGQQHASGLYPTRHVQQNLDKKNRRVEMDYDSATQTVSVDINPPLGSQGVPPASMAERYAADDTLSAVLHLMLRGQAVNAPLCAGGVRVFDSKQHYNLRMQRAGEKTIKFDGEKHDTILCHVYYEPISGFDPEDLPEPEEESTPVKVYFMKEAQHGLHVPLRFTYKISGFKAVIKVTEMKMRAPKTAIERATNITTQ